MDTDQVVTDNDIFFNERTADSICLQWKHTNPQPDSYMIRYRPLHSEGVFTNVTSKENCIVLNTLKSGTSYDIIILDGESHKPIYKTKTATKETPAEDLFRKSSKDIDNPDIYQLPTKETGLENDVHCLQLDLDPSEDFTITYNCPEKTIILLGQHYSGKTTLVNAMINYIAGVNFADKRRLKISCGKKHNNVVAHSYWISTQEYFQIQCRLNIIDVSRFYTEQNAWLKSLIKALNNLGIHRVDAFCLVMPIAITRQLRSDSENIYNYIFKHFPLSNILPMITFDDEGVIQDLTDIFSLKRSLTYFRFNNSDLLTSTDDPRNWNQRQITLESFFNHLSTIKHVNVSIKESSPSASLPDPTRSCSKCTVYRWIALVCILILLGSYIFALCYFVKKCVCRRHP